MVSSDASDELVQLRAELAIARAQALVAEAEAAKVWAINADLRARNAHLELMNEQMRREKYGARSERSRRLLDQLELTFVNADRIFLRSAGAKIPRVDLVISH